MLEGLKALIPSIIMMIKARIEGTNPYHIMIRDIVGIGESRDFAGFSSSM
jgi:hypothetical protein